METITDEHPVLFKPEMVRAILDGRKTQTRRVVKPQPPTVGVLYWHDDGDGTIVGFRGMDNKDYHCPYGQPGDVLWVREAFVVNRAFDDLSPTALWHRYQDEKRGIAAANRNGTNHTGAFTKGPDVFYPADGSTLRGNDMLAEMPGLRGRKRPSIHMPRWACRLRLRLTDVWAERVQAITREEALAEGIGANPHNPFGYGPVAAFEELWDEINAGRGYPWIDNPWVWVLTFEKID